MRALIGSVVVLGTLYTLSLSNEARAEESSSITFGVPARQMFGKSADIYMRDYVKTDHPEEGLPVFTTDGFTISRMAGDRIFGSVPQKANPLKGHNYRLDAGKYFAKGNVDNGIVTRVFKVEIAKRRASEPGAGAYKWQVRSVSTEMLPVNSGILRPLPRRSPGRHF